MKPAGRLRRTVPKLVLLAVSLGLCFLLLEVALRLVGYGAVGERDGNVVHHVTDEFRHDAVLNSLDLRDREIGPKPAEEFRVLVVGDSFTYGLGVEEPETFVRRLEADLRARAEAEGRPGSIRVINGGVGGGPFRQQSWLREVGIELEPDLVVLAFFIGNDVYDSLAWYRTRGETEVARLPWWRRAVRSSSAINWTWSRLTVIPVVDRWMFRAGLRHSADGLFLREMPEAERRGWDLTFGELRTGLRMLRERDVPVFAMIIPTAFQVRYGDQRGPAQDNERPNRLLTEFFDDEDVESLDLLPRLEDRPDRDDLYYMRDLHWTARGHEVTAGILAERLWPVLAAESEGGS